MKSMYFATLGDSFIEHVLVYSGRSEWSMLADILALDLFQAQPNMMASFRV